MHTNLSNLHELNLPTLRSTLTPLFAESRARGGVYILHCKRPDRVEGLRRLIGEDPDWWLYVGHGANLMHRVEALFTSLTYYGSRAHHVGVNFQRHPLLAEHFPLPELQLLVMPLPQPRWAERHTLEVYSTRHGELPPLNVRSS